jgi:hypothetical protein
MPTLMAPPIIFFMKTKRNRLTSGSNRKKKRANPAMPENRRSTAKKQKSLKEKYLGYFSPIHSPLWRNDDENYSLEQPSPLKWVPSETTYGIGPVVEPISIHA